jgi:hemerythrin superfamily protein
MPTKSAAKSANKTRTQDAIQLLRADHAEVSEMFEKYENGRMPKDRKAALAQKICQALTVHSQIEEEIFYPACREASKKLEDLLDEAEVEHDSVKKLIAEVEGGSPDDELFDARVKVIAEYVKHHVKEEQNELFPKVKETDLDLKELGARLAARKEELMGESEPRSRRAAE